MFLFELPKLSVDLLYKLYKIKSGDDWFVFQDIPPGPKVKRNFSGDLFL